MKPSRRTTSHRTTSRPTQRDAHEDAAAQMPNSPNPASAPSKDQLGAAAEPYTPLSLKSGAGRRYWDDVLRLLVQIRADCDAAVERLGYVSHKDDGLAAVEYIANKILDAVRGERQQQIASAKKQSAPRPHDVSQQSPTEAQHKSDKRAQRAQPVTPSERSTLIGELKQMLRDGKTKMGAVIGPQLAHEIAKHVTTLTEELAQPETPQSIKRIRERLARFFGKDSGGRKTPSEAAAVAVPEKRKPAKPEPSRAKKTMTKRSVAKPSVTKRSKGSKRRSR